MKRRILSSLLLIGTIIHCLSVSAMQSDPSGFFTYIEQGNLEGITHALQNGFNVNATTGKLQQTALHIAAENGNGVIIQALLDNGADINVCDKRNQTPLFCAVGMGKKEAIKVLLSNGANPDAAADALGMPKFQEPIDLSISTVFDDRHRKITKMLALYGAYFKNTAYQLTSVLRNVSFKDQPLAGAIVCDDKPNPKIVWEAYIIQDKELKHAILAAAAREREEDLSRLLDLFQKSNPDLLKKTVHKAFTVAAFRSREHAIDLLWLLVKEDDKTVNKTFVMIQNLLKYATLTPEQRTSYQKTESKILSNRIYQNLLDSYFSALPRDIKAMAMEYYAKFS